MGRWGTVVIAVVACGASACATADIGRMGPTLKKRAAHEFACDEKQTRVVDADSGVYRITGCGMVIGYQCSETAALNVHCQQLYVSKLPAETQPKQVAGSSLAKSP